MFEYLLINNNVGPRNVSGFNLMNCKNSNYGGYNWAKDRTMYLGFTVFAQKWRVNDPCFINFKLCRNVKYDASHNLAIVSI